MGPCNQLFLFFVPESFGGIIVGLWTKNSTEEKIQNFSQNLISWIVNIIATDFANLQSSNHGEEEPTGKWNLGWYWKKDSFLNNVIEQGYSTQISPRAKTNLGSYPRAKMMCLFQFIYQEIKLKAQNFGLGAPN